MGFNSSSIGRDPAILVSQSGAEVYAVDTGAANAYVVAYTPAFAEAPPAGTRLIFKAANANTGASTLAINGLTAIDIVKGDGSNLFAGDIKANQLVTVAINAAGKAQLTGSSVSIDTDGTMAGDSDGVVPSQKATRTYIASQLSGILASRPFKGDFDATGALSQLANAQAGWEWIVTVAGTILTDLALNVGDVIIARQDYVGNPTTSSQLIKIDNTEAPDILRTSHLDTDTTLAANSDTKIATQKATKTYIDTGLGTKVPTSRTVNGHALTADVTVTKGDVGLGNVDNVQQLPMSYLDTDNTLATNSDARVPSQKAIKAYVDNSMSAMDIGTLSATGTPVLAERLSGNFFALRNVAAGSNKVTVGLKTAISEVPTGIDHTLDEIYLTDATWASILMTGAYDFFVGKITSTGTVPTGLTSGKTYFFGKTAATTYKVFEVGSNTPIDFTSNGTGTLTIEEVDQAINIDVVPDNINHVGTLASGSVVLSGGAGNAFTAAVAGVDIETPNRWTAHSGTSATITANGRHALTNAANVTCPLPTTAAVYDTFEISKNAAGKFTLTQAAGQSIVHLNKETTVGTGGSLEALDDFAYIKVQCITANTRFKVLTVEGSIKGT